MKVFIISWQGNLRDALEIASELDRVQCSVSVIYSGLEETPKGSKIKVIHRPKELFWEDKFKACLDNSESENLLVIHADCKCENWASVFNNCKKAFSEFTQIGVWAPKIDWAFFDLDHVKIAKIRGTPLWFSILTDGIVFALSADIVKRMKQFRYTDNTYGWGIDIIFCSAAYLMKKWVVIDESLLVMHPRSTGYDKAGAEEGMTRFLSQASVEERVHATILRQHVHLKRLVSYVG